MSFTRLLAAGRSIIGIRKGPGPYRMNPGNLLPKFPPVRKTGSGVDPSGLTAESNVPQEPIRATGAKSALVSVGNCQGYLGVAEGKRQGILRRVFTQMALTLTRRRSQAGLVRGEEQSPVRAGLALDRLKVVRNDLSDSEVEFSATRSRAVAGSQRRGSANTTLRQPLGMVWNRLSANLLRQAADEFNLVQKERGKLLSQAGHGSAGARGS
jgi:hypothetical protein